MEWNGIGMYARREKRGMKYDRDQKRLV